jgi:hypothetical protein
MNAVLGSNAIPMWNPSPTRSLVDTGINTAEVLTTATTTFAVSADPTTAIVSGDRLRIENEAPMWVVSTHHTADTVTVSRPYPVAHADARDIYKITKSDCVLWLPGQDDAPSATIRDRSGYGNHGVMSSGKIEGTGFNQITNITLMAWVNPGELPTTSVAGGSIVLSNGGKERKGFAFGIGNGSGADGSNLMALIDAVQWVNSNYTFPSTNTWYHCVCLRGATDLIFYVNGQLQSGSANASPIAGSLTYTIGDQGALDYKLLGKVAFPRIFSNALSITQIAGIYQSERHLFRV